MAGSSSRIPVKSTPPPSSPLRSSRHQPPSSFSRSRSHLPPPRILPFPDQVLSKSREGSQSSSPLASPQPTRAGSSVGHVPSISIESFPMVVTGSSDSGEGTALPRRNTISPVPSPLGVMSSPTLSSEVIVGGRARSQTSPSPRHTLPAPDETLSPESASPPRKASPPRSKPLPSTQPISTPSPLPVNDHIYESFLKGHCADVRLWVRKWGVAWHVHKMILVQAGFFHSLFLGGFSEMNPMPSRKGKGKASVEDDDWAGEEIELTFDDPNITRAAFEICLSRLYSSHPHFHIPAHILPHPTHPISTSLHHDHPNSLVKMHLSLPNHTHLLTPRLLLSLLATTTYLGHSLLMREVLSTILRTIGPMTISRYYGFAIGDGVGPEEWEGQNEAAARHLEKVARPMPSAETNRPTNDLGDTSSISASTVGANDHLPHYYGFPSDKIGEACACWLSRWGRDIIDEETESQLVWNTLPASLISAVLCSDSFFVANEMERYRVARRALDLRRQKVEADSSSITESERWFEDESELQDVFATGIYYTHMSFEDLSTIASDIDSSTGFPYAPMTVLQSAHWSAAHLKAKIADSSSDETLGLAQSTTSLLSVRRSTPRSRIPSSSSVTSSDSSSPLLHPIPKDDTHRIGASGLPFAKSPSIAGLPDLGPESDFYDGSLRRRPPPQGENTTFGLMNGSKTLAQITDEHGLSLAALSIGGGDSPESRWTKNEPFRFSVEFWGVERLAEKERAYSSTVFYAGSWFNVYVQPIRKKDKGTQLGIYLQRQNPSEQFPTPSSPDNSSTGQVTMSQSRPSMWRSMSATSPSIGSPARPGFSQPKVEHDAPYTDNRAVIKAYFSITCASALGTALIRFSSAPDSFTVSQSWGWKSSALRSEEYLSGLATPEGAEKISEGVLGWTGDTPSMGGSLRATVVVGLI